MTGDFKRGICFVEIFPHGVEWVYASSFKSDLVMPPQFVFSAFHRSSNHTVSYLDESILCEFQEDAFRNREKTEIYLDPPPSRRHS